MSSHIKGVTVRLAVQTVTGRDELNAEVVSTVWADIPNVLVGEPTAQEITDSHELYGKRLAYRLAIPKGDTHVWTDTTVILPAPFAGVYRTYGPTTAGIEDNIPLDWNKKVMIERVDG